MAAGIRWLTFSPRATRAFTLAACGVIAIGASIVYARRYDGVPSRLARMKIRSLSTSREDTLCATSHLSQTTDRICVSPVRLDCDPLPDGDKQVFPQLPTFARKRDEQKCTRSAKQSSEASESAPSSCAEEVSPDLQDDEREKVASTDSDQSPPSVGWGRFLTPCGVRDDLLEEDGGVLEGGFGSVAFFSSRTAPRERFALKKAKDTPAGRRQMQREVDFFDKLANRTSGLQHVVRVADLLKSPAPMLLMHREEITLDKMLEVGEETDIAGVARVLDGVLLGVENLYSNGYFHRDIKPDNILVGRDKRGILTDFGLCMSTKDVLDGKGIGDGTPEYTAPETVVGRWSTQAEIYAVFTCFTEAVVGRCVFGGEELLEIKSERKADVEAAFEDAEDDLKYSEEEVEKGDQDYTEEEIEELRLEVESASAQVDRIKIQLWRLQLDVGQGEPDDAARAKLASTGPPLSLFVSSIETADDSRRAAMCLEAKRQPTRLFEEDWVRWVPSSSKEDLKEEVERAMNFVLAHHALDPNPASRPQTVTEARQVLMTAAATYEGTVSECRRS